jgi:hypothetical protein
MDVLVLVVFAAGLMVLGAATVATARQSFHRHRRDVRERALRACFGAEYDRVVAIEGRTEGELVLERRLVQFQDINAVPLSPADRKRFVDAWRALEAVFADDAARGVRNAEDLTVRVLRDQGFDGPDGKARADALSVYLPQLAELYRDAHRVFGLAQRDGASTAELENAASVYRALGAGLLGCAPSELTSVPRLVDADAGARA